MVENRVRSMIQQDPPDHTRLRGLVNKAFTPRAVAAMEESLPAYRRQHAEANAAALRAGFDLVPEPVAEAWASTAVAAEAR